ncbi:HXXEE domain-containing protein [Bacillus cihuensis]|uniref:HXXEE domain-containing protein n=1 Tax=Bacillus cihuensis TaxID=1208599 RepID=UPI001377516F
MFLGIEPLTFFSSLVPGLLLANVVSHFIQFIILKDYVLGIFTSMIVHLSLFYYNAQILVQ